MPDTDDKKTDDAQKDGAKNDSVDHAAEAEKWKALSRKHEDQAKANKAELDALKADKDSSKSDAEKLEARVAAAEKRAETAELNGLRFQVAADKKLTPAQAKRLQGTTLAELEADADDLIEAFGVKPGTGDGKEGDGGDADAAKDKEQTTSGGRPKEKLRTGAADTGAESEEDDPREIVAKIPRDRF